MSLKSFDKFCEKITNGEPVPKKEIYDERQKVIRSRLLIETFCVFLFASLFNCWLMDYWCKWADTYVAATAFILVICFVYLEIRLMVKGCLVGAEGKKTGRRNTVAGIIVLSLCLPMHVPNIGKSDFFIKNGALSNSFIFTVCIFIIMTIGIYQFCVYNRNIRREKKRNESEEQK